MATYSPQTRLLPYMEQTVLFNCMNMSLSYSDPTNTTGIATTVTGFICPSDAVSSVPVGWAGINYRANQGTRSSRNRDRSGPGPTRPERAFRLRSDHPDRQYHDGTSNTAAFSEHLKGDYSNTVSTDTSEIMSPTPTRRPPIRPCRCVSRPTSRTWPTRVTRRRRTLGLRLPLDDSLLPLRCAQYVVVMFPPSRIMTNANSKHPGGVNVMLADGWVRFVKSGVDLGTWRAIGMGAYGEVVSSDSY